MATCYGLASTSALDWPQRFRAAHGRGPRVLHICNIANYAYVNAKMMRRYGVESVVLDPDFYHVASTPEWIEADLSGDHGDDYFPRWRDVTVRDFQRPDWFLNGPTPFVLHELAAREANQRAEQAFFHRLSKLYRNALASHTGQPSAFRRFMEGNGLWLRYAKDLARFVTLGPRQGAIAVTPSAAIRTDDAELIRAMMPPRVSADVMRSALAGFDAIIGYSLGARYAAALGLPRFISLELGTLRGLPFEDSELGRICAYVYKRSPAVFVTNLDCLEPAQRLGIPQDRVTAIPHPFDVDAALQFGASGAHHGHGTPYFFCPARHHWHAGNASWLKGNDVLIRGAAMAAARGLHFRLIMVEWGNEVDLSRALIAELGLTERVDWIRITPRRSLWPIIAGAVAVLDQFAATAFGGVGLETMAIGKPVISRIEGVDLGPFFQTRPPIQHAATPEEVAGRIAEALSDQLDHRGAGRAGQAWMKTEHSVERQLALQFAALARLTSNLISPPAQAGL